MIYLALTITVVALLAVAIATPLTIMVVRWMDRRKTERNVTVSQTP